MLSLGVANGRLNSRPSDGGRAAVRSPGCCNQQSVAVSRQLASKDEPLLAGGHAFLIRDLDRTPQNSAMQLSFNLKINKLKLKMDSLLEPSPCFLLGSARPGLLMGIARPTPSPQPSSAAGLACPLSPLWAPALGMVVSSSAGAQALLWPQWGTRVVLTGLLVFPDQLT